MVLLFLGIINYRLRLHGEGLRQCEHSADKGGAGSQFFIILCGCLFGWPLIHISGSCIQPDSL